MAITQLEKMCQAHNTIHAPEIKMWENTSPRVKLISNILASCLGLPIYM